MPEMYNGRPLKKGVKLEKIERDGKEVVKLILPPGCKNPYADEEKDKKPARKTVKSNPQKDIILEKLVTTLKGFSYDDNVYRTPQGKYAIKTTDGKWFSLALTANKVEPKDRVLWEPKKDEESGE